MRFEAIPLQAVKSISQRNLAVHWQGLQTRFGLPRFADFSPGERAHDPRQLLLWTVDGRNGERSYRHLYAGTYAFEVFGPDASADSVPECLRDIFKSGLDACATSAGLIYMSIDTSDPSGHPIACERLLLPFGSGSHNVTHILASLQLVSLEGTFQRRTILQQFERKTEVTLCGRIQPASRPIPSAAATLARRSHTA